MMEMDNVKIVRDLQQSAPLKLRCDAMSSECASAPGKREKQIEGTCISPNGN